MIVPAVTFCGTAIFFAGLNLGMWLIRRNCEPAMRELREANRQLLDVNEQLYNAISLGNVHTETHR